MESDDLEPRVSSLEQQVGDLTRRVRASEQDARAARVLAGGADRDVGELGGELRDFRQATAAGFNALRQDFVDLRQDFGDLRSHVDEGFRRVDSGFIEMRSKFDAAAAGQQHIVGLLEAIATDPERNQPGD